LMTCEFEDKIKQANKGTTMDSTRVKKYLA